MATIYKYPLPLDDFAVIRMPRGASVLCVQTQDDRLQIWALVAPATATVERRFRVAGTGHPVDFADAQRYVGTFQMRDGALVFHVFDLGEA